MNDYIILSHTNPEELAKLVNSKLSSGYMCVGGIATTIAGPFTDLQVILAQAMVKQEKQNNDK